MHVILANPVGMCSGVRGALCAAERIERPQSVTIFGQLVHNEVVLARLRQRGFQTMPEHDRSKLPATPEVLIPAHGISDAQRHWLEAAGKRLIDATCPLVGRVHQAARTLAIQGRYVLLIGKPGHVEVEGIVEDLPQCEVVSCAGEVRSYPCNRLGIVCQTTTPPHVADEIRLAVTMRNLRAEIRFVDTICRATRARQRAVEELLSRVDAMVVVGGRNSNNTRELAALCRQRGVPALHVQSADDLDPKWFQDCRTVGLTAGTSTLDETISQVRQALCQLNAGITGSPACF